MTLLLPGPPSLAIPDYNYSGRPTLTYGTVLTSGGSANTEGTKVELIAATSQDYDTIDVAFYGAGINGSNTGHLVSLYTGSSFGHTLCQNLLAGWSFASLGDLNGIGPHYTIPFFIPRGTRIGAATRAVITSDTITVLIKLRWRGKDCGRRFDSAGADIFSSNGIAITTGAASEGSWTTLGTTNFNWKWIIPVIWQSNTSITAVNVLSLDIGTGSAAIPNLDTSHITQLSTIEYSVEAIHPLAIPCNIPSGTSLQGRIQGHSTSITACAACYGIG